MTTVYIPTPLRKFTNNSAKVLSAPGTVAAVFAALESSYPGVRNQLYGDDGTIKRYINVFVNGKDIRSLEGEQTQVDERDEVFIVPAMAGG